jgi:hypothetical protein
MDNILDLMLMQDPTALDMDRQKAVANSLRGMASLGALGSTSGIKDIADSGKSLRGQAFATGKQMGLDKAARRGEEQRIAEMLYKEEQANERARMMREAQMQRAQLSSQRRGMGMGDWRATQNERTSVIQLAQDIEELEGLGANFTPDLANEGAGFVRSAMRKGLNKEPGFTKWLAKQAGEYLPEGMVDAMAIPTDEDSINRFETWWKLYDRLDRIKERNDAFGATLTPGEAAAWEAADISERASPEQVQANLKIRGDLLRNALARRLDQLESLGYPTDTVNQTRDRLNLTENPGANMADSMAAIFNQMMGGGGAAAPAAAGNYEEVVQDGVPDGVDPAEWAELSEEEKLYFLQNGGL